VDEGRGPLWPPAPALSLTLFRRGEESRPSEARARGRRGGVHVPDSRPSSPRFARLSMLLGSPQRVRGGECRMVSSCSHTWSGLLVDGILSRCSSGMWLYSWRLSTSSIKSAGCTTSVRHQGGIVANLCSCTIPTLRRGECLAMDVLTRLIQNSLRYC